MPPKKPTGKAGAPPTVGKPAEASGLYIPCHLPPWDEADVEREDWGDLNLVLTPQTLASFLFTDGGIPEGATVAPTPVVPYLANHVKEWKRPSAIFSPFKPVVVRAPSTATGSPNPGASQLNATDANGDTTAEKPRLMRQFKNDETLPSADAPASPTLSAAAPPVDFGDKGKRRVRRDRTQNATPPFMRAFNSALMVLQQHEGLLTKGQYAWELIYPQVNGYPIFNPAGKYAVKLFWNGAFFKVVIDDRLPTDIFGQSMYTVTTSKEIWPALLVKAILKALGPGNESVLFLNPLLTLSCVLCGWVPQILSPVKDEVDLLKIFHKHETGHGNLLICGLTPALDGAPAAAYAITGVQRSGEMCTLTVVTSHHVGVSPDIQVVGSHDVHPSWQHVRIPWSAMKSVLASVIVMRPTMPTTASLKSVYVDTKQIYAAPQTSDAIEPQTPSHHNPTSHSKWVVIKAAADAELLFVHSVAYGNNNTNIGNREANTPDSTLSPHRVPTPTRCHVTVQAYNWKQRPHLKTLLMLESPVSATNSAHYLLPKGTHVLKVDVEGLIPNKAAFSILCSTDAVAWGEEKEILSGSLALTRWSDAGGYAVHEPNALTVWFKRHIFVKGASAECCVVLSSLPRGTDVEQHKVPLPVSDIKGGKGAPAEKAAKPGAKVSSATVPSVVVAEEVVIPDPLIDIMAHTELILVDLDTNLTTRSHDGKIMNTVLHGNKAGYMLMASAVTPVAYPRGLWVTSVTAEGTFERIDTRLFDDVISKTGEYKVNAIGHVFKYFVTALEATTASIVISLVESLSATYNVTVTHNDKVILTRTDVKGMCLLEHVAFVPPEKGATSVYSVNCVLDPTTAAVLKHTRSERVKEAFHMAPHTISAMTGTDVKYTIKFLAASPKLEVKDDTSAAEALAVVKANWSRPKDAVTDAVAAKPAKPTKDKGLAVVDDGGRTSKAKESRAKYLASLSTDATPNASFEVAMASRPARPTATAVELQAKTDAYIETLSRDFKTTLAASRNKTEDHLLSIQKAMDASAVVWAARRKEALGADGDVDAKGKGGGAKKK